MWLLLARVWLCEDTYDSDADAAAYGGDQL